MKDFSLNVYVDTNLWHLVSDSQRLSFSQELTPTLTLGLGLGLGIAKNVLVYMALIAFKSFIEFVFIFFLHLRALLLCGQLLYMWLQQLCINLGGLSWR